MAAVVAPWSPIARTTTCSGSRRTAASRPGARSASCSERPGSQNAIQGAWSSSDAPGALAARAQRDRTGAGQGMSGAREPAPGTRAARDRAEGPPPSSSSTTMGIPRGGPRPAQLDGLRVVGEAADGAGALAAVARLEPALLVLDVGLPDVSGPRPGQSIPTAGTRRGHRAHLGSAGVRIRGSGRGVDRRRLPREGFAGPGGLRGAPGRSGRR